jgi:hypothetical protein
MFYPLSPLFFFFPQITNWSRGGPRQHAEQRRPTAWSLWPSGVAWSGWVPRWRAEEGRPTAGARSKGAWRWRAEQGGLRGMLWRGDRRPRMEQWSLAVTHGARQRSEKERSVVAFWAGDAGDAEEGRPAARVGEVIRGVGEIGSVIWRRKEEIK